MKKIYVLMVFSLLCFLLLGRTRAMAFGGCEEDCAKCHSLEKSEAQQILAKLNAPDAKVIDIKMSPIRGLWEVTVDEKTGRGILYVGFSKKYVVGGPIFEIDTAANKTRDTLKEANRAPDRYVDVTKIPVKDAIVLGKPSARYKVIVFTDPECPYCAKLHQELKKIVSERTDISFYLELMPLKFHPDARWKAESILCGKSLELLDENFEKKPIPRPGPKCGGSKAVDENIRTAQELGITGTPTLIMPDGLVVVGGRSAAEITGLILRPRGKEVSK